ncbi:hypothetical protein ACQYRI_18660 [Salmonella enterica]
MPVSAIQHRERTGNHQEKSKSTISNLHAVNPPPENNAPAIPHVTSQLTQIENTMAAFTTPSVLFNSQRGALTFALSMLLILEQIRPVEAVPLINSETGLSLPFSTYPVIENCPPLPINRTTEDSVTLTERNIPGNKGLCRDNASDGFILSGGHEKEVFFKVLTRYFVATGFLTADQQGGYQRSLIDDSANYPVLLAPLNLPHPETTQRTRRALAAESDPKTKEHIKEFCGEEEEIFNLEGKNEGKVLLFEAQRIDNPFRIAIDNTTAGPTPEERGVVDGLNLALNIVTVGMKPLIGGIIANAKRYKYHNDRGDNICAEKYRRLIIAEVATSIDADAIPFARGSGARHLKPQELQNIKSELKKAAFYTRNKQTNILSEVLLELHKGKGAINDNGRKIYLKPTDKENEFVTFYPHAVDPKKLERRVIVDPDKLTWRYADTFDSSTLNVKAFEGKKYIEIHGEYHELNKNTKDGYEIVLNKSTTGKKEYIPVYMELLTKKWHLQTHNGFPVFNKQESAIIKKIKASKNANLLYVQEKANNPNSYGSASTFRAEKPGDESHYVEGRYIELKGELVPVRQKVTPGHGVRYEVYDAKKGYPVEWDGNRWVFERPTSPHITGALEKKITPEMFAKDVDTSLISASGDNGLQWDSNNNSYLKVKGSYIKVRKKSYNRYTLLNPLPGQRKILRFKKNQFHLEDFKERLRVICSEGFGGRKRKHPADVLTDTGYFTREEADNLLAQFDFPEDGYFSSYSMALEVEQRGTIPNWAWRFHKMRRVEPSEGVSQTVTVTPATIAGQTTGVLPTTQLRFGDKVGPSGELYIDANDSMQVIKKYPATSYANPAQSAAHESQVFNSYYGPGAAQAFYDAAGNSYTRMYHLPTDNLDYVPVAQLPTDRGERFVDMVERISEAGLPADQLTSGNILWDQRSQSFMPIDINNILEAPLTTGMKNKADIAQFRKNHWEKLLNDITRSAPAEPLAVNKEAAAAIPEPAVARAPVVPKPGTSARQTPAEPIPGTSARQTPAEPVPGTSARQTPAEPVPGTSARQTPAEQMADISQEMANNQFIEKRALEMTLKTTSLDALLHTASMNIANIKGSLDRMVKAILVTKNKSLQLVQINRLEKLKTEVERGINSRTSLERINDFILEELRNVLNPGYSIHGLPNTDMRFTYKIIERDSKPYNVLSTRSDAESLNILYPEDGQIVLHQKPMDNELYKAAVNKLTPDERSALRSWTATPAEKGREYSNGEISEGVSTKDFVNGPLIARRLFNDAQQRIYNDMISASQPGKIPLQPGDYLMTIPYASKRNPWIAERISTGDYVTNGRRLLSVSSDTAIARNFVREHEEEPMTMVHIKIKTDKGPIPLLPNTLSIANPDKEYLYRPNSYFVVKDISISHPLAPISLLRHPRVRSDIVRIGVTLEEKPLPTETVGLNVKDIFSGFNAETNALTKKNKAGAANGQG